MSKTMSKKTEIAQAIETDDFDSLLGIQHVAEPDKTAFLFLSDEGKAGKSTAAIAFTTILRKLNKTVDAWQCDPDHMKLYYGFGKRDASGTLISKEAQVPSDCGYLNIRTESFKLVNSLKSPAKYKIYDLPAASIDELPEIFDSSDSFLQAFVNNNTKIVFCVPFINGIDSLLAVQKLKNLFCGVNSNAVIEFVLLLNYSMMIDESETLAGLDSAIKGMKEKVYAAHIKTKFTPGFENIIDYTEDGPNRDWFSILGSLDETSKITMGKFLKDYVDTVKAVY
ncbi:MULTISPECIES: hypothetical protein [Burkholderiaceae]|jgi:hypothetical protein|uniref:CobQ/CobB/MinD/ParA nucleotide binding domain-containing protein n=2 Tax=Burkholderiaceae TaxID=119060 RepID=A0A6J5JHJ7_9BURK|nr:MULTISPECIES: hypothetical protein [Burkholderiaceae]ANJ73116.1 hypothetical protein A9Y76_11810 [Ralstonia insidiosa]KAB0601816.1 hypothetical protein F7R19_15055 [Cupriavidus pauculus]MBR8501502.1 hypothetical protein [Burkholderia cenocepacia]UAL00246.1 hypothetical protein K8O84_02395 [Cupriavidus pauculus]CAB3970787.1 hypothetical protein BLA3211_06119 [Burkholderia aenigmatica]